MCRLGFHKWQNYGNKIEVFWNEPSMVSRAGHTGAYAPLHKEARAVHSEAVYEGQECKRCGAKIRRKLVTNSDGTLSCVGWEPDTKETDKEPTASSA